VKPGVAIEDAMNPQEYDNLLRNEKTHWWCLGRRGILADVIRHLVPSSAADILEIGCGPGGNLEILADFGHVDAVEMSQDAIDMIDNRFGSAKYKYRNICVRQGQFPESFPFAGDQYDLVCMFDVLEHIADDYTALVAARDLLNPCSGRGGGKLLLTVSAYQSLWGRA
jgi:SAM-dependent methyltransferase